MKKFNKTLAIALAAGLSVGGVSVPVGNTGHSFRFGAVSASAAGGKVLDASVIKSHSIISDKSKVAIDNKVSFFDLDGRNAFIEKHGTNAKFDVDLEIPNSAKTGDNIAFKFDGSFVPNMKDANGQDILAKGRNGETFVVGRWRYTESNKTVTFTLSKDASDYYDRKVHIEIPIRIEPIGITTNDENLNGKSKSQVGTVSLVSTGQILNEFKYSAPYLYTYDKGILVLDTYDYTLLINENRHGFISDSVVPNINTSRFEGVLNELRIGQANVNRSRDLIAAGVVEYDKRAGGNRVVTIKYTLDNPNFRFEKNVDNPRMWWDKGVINWIVRDENGKTVYESYVGDDKPVPDGVQTQKPQISVTVSKDGQTAEVKVTDLNYRDGILAKRLLRVVGDYNPGDKFTVTGKFVNGVGDPYEAYDHDYSERREFTYTMPSIAQDGSGTRYVKKAEMVVKVNGKDANNQESAERITGNKARFNIELKNTGTIGASEAVIKFPRGVKDAAGNTERVVNFSDGSFKPGSTKNIDLGELIVSDGIQENKFVVEINGFETMSDPAWTTIAPKPAQDIFVKEITKLDNGDYLVTRNDGTKWTIKLEDIRNKIAELEKNKADKTEVAKLKEELNALETTVTTEFKQVKGDITQLKSDLTKLTTRVTNLEKRVGNLEKKQITKVVGDKGKYTLVREDGSVVDGVIDTSSNVVSIKDNGDGTVTITRVDGSKETVTLTHTKVVEDKKKNTVTITTPGGKPVVINTFDTFISDVKKLDNGDYLVTRNDGKSWTISISELQKQINDLGSKLAETNKDLAELKETAASKEEVAKLQEELDKHTEQLADHEQRLKELEANGATKDDIAALEKEIADNKAAIDGITEQITTIITRVETLEKGVADNAHNIEGLKKDLGDVTNQVDKNTGDIANNGNNIADLRDKIVTNTQEIMDLKEKTATKEQLLEVVKQVENHEKRITDLENQGASKEELAKTQAELDELKNKQVALENKAATKADVENFEREIADHADKIAALEAETAELNSKLVELTRVVTERFEKVIERIDSLETRADETDKALGELGARVTELEVSVQNIKIDITKLGDRVSSLEAKVTDLTKRVESVEVSDKRQDEIHDAWAKCYSGISTIGVTALLVAPLLALGAGAGNGSQMNTDIQKQLGIYNPEMAKWMAENQSVLKALGAVAGLAASLGLLSYAAKQCSDYNRTEPVKKTLIGQLFSKFD